MLLCYPINDKKAFDNLKEWINEIDSQCESDVLIFLCGTKSDLDGERIVSISMAREFQLASNLHYAIETSALEDINIRRLFTDMAKFLYLRFKSQIDAERAAS